MNKNGWLLTLSAGAMVCACARSTQNGFDTSTFGSSGTGQSASSGQSANGEGGGPSFGSGSMDTPPPETDATLNLLPSSGSGDGGGADDASDASSTAETLCVATRTCNVGACDELNPTGSTTGTDGSHVYIEQMPDDGSAPPLAADLTPFTTGTASTTGGPCITEPPTGALFPNNWARVRFNYAPPSDPNNPPDTIYQIRIHTARQAHDLLAYTRSPTWKLPQSVWSALAASTWGEDITATITSLKGTALASSQVTFQIAPAQSNGTMVYWAAVGMAAGQSWLESFSPGDENAGQALTVPDVQWNIARANNGNLQNGPAGAGSIQCIGCHVAVPDRSSVLFLDTYPWDGVAATVNPEAGTPGTLPPWLTAGGMEALSQPWFGMMSFSTSVWNAGTKRAVAASQMPPGPTAWDGMNYQGSPASLVWIDLATTAPAVLGGNAASPPSAANVASFEQNNGTSYGTIARTGDANSALAPAWSHDGKTVVYVSNNAPGDGRLGQAQGGGTIADLYSVPYNGGAGGNATAIPGASDPNFLEYYPSVSPDDKYVVFNKAPSTDNPYYDANSEVNVVPIGGGTAMRLAANDPPACMGVHSPGVTNSWPKFAPDGPQCSGKTYYWLIFSSTRDKVLFSQEPQFGQTTNTPYTSQLYLTALVDDGTGALTTYPGIFVWAQHTVVAGTKVSQFAGVTQSNHTPQWEEVELAPPPPPPPPPPPKQPK